MPLSRLRTFLDENGVKYTTLKHSPAWTAMELAEAAHIPGREVAKTVMVKLDGRMALAVLPATERVDLAAFAAENDCREASLAQEDEFAELFPGCEVGAMPPFGNLWGMPVYVSDTLAEDEYIAFPAGSHTEVLSLAFADFQRLVDPKVEVFTTEG